ncbi:MAG: hypothetical protein EB157_05265 [Euryarchaeota archaeon]|nr:hypothetical protein [Euryarchaeota archaeon]
MCRRFWLVCGFIYSVISSYAGIDIVFDYSYDTTNWFGNEQRYIMDQAAYAFESRLGSESFGSLIPSDSTRELTVTLDQEGTFLYEDPINDHRALGLGGMLVVSDFNGPEYYGVFAEHNQEWVVPISEGGSYDRREYHPEAFTINGKGFPDTMRDSLAFIMGGVGDTIRIHMTNAGMMYHFPHFHGYHVKIIEATYHKRYIGWMKDSYGMAPGESITVEFVPDKPGMFPMHNHNLVTTTIGGNYPGGMMMHMHIHE